MQRDVAAYLRTVLHGLASRGVRQFLIAEGVWRHEDWCRKSLIDVLVPWDAVERVLICEVDASPARCGFASASASAMHVVRGSLIAPTTLISVVTELIEWHQPVGVLASIQAIPTPLHLEHAVRSLSSVMASEGYLSLMHPVLDSPPSPPHPSEPLPIEHQHPRGFRNRSELRQALIALDLATAAATAPVEMGPATGRPDMLVARITARGCSAARRPRRLPGGTPQM